MYVLLCMYHRYSSHYLVFKSQSSDSDLIYKIDMHVPSGCCFVRKPYQGQVKWMSFVRSRISWEE